MVDNSTARFRHWTTGAVFLLHFCSIRALQIPNNTGILSESHVIAYWSLSPVCISIFCWFVCLTKNRFLLVCFCCSLLLLWLSLIIIYVVFIAWCWLWYFDVFFVVFMFGFVTVHGNFFSLFVCCCCCCCCCLSCCLLLSQLYDIWQQLMLMLLCCCYYCCCY